VLSFGGLAYLVGFNHLLVLGIRRSTVQASFTDPVWRAARSVTPRLDMSHRSRPAGWGASSLLCSLTVRARRRRERQEMKWSLAFGLARSVAG